ncbi:hypothetical protein FNF27_01896 [Cafeteria roenbergensis]|uniref:Tubulin--tyrosine ligase-like protein 9 n=2 Tax=Cafeteria roenbergensis TaxID=33653 RepID=A0A5A8EFF7_CAFRO|nr:hypothetical protein FNF27_01896 [Cafeteria roenbergensis]
MQAVLRIDSTPETVPDALAAQGWRIWNQDADSEDDWHLWFRCGGFTRKEMASARLHQRVNRIAGAAGVCAKDRLLRAMSRLRMAYGADAYGFHPEGFCLPSERHRFQAACSAASVPVAPSDPSWAVRDGLWVCKPSDLSRGRKVCVVRGPGDVSIDQGSVVQRYLARPLCANGYKFDLRLYVVVTSVRPLRAFLYHDGLVRFATKPYAAARPAHVEARPPAPAAAPAGSARAGGWCSHRCRASPSRG